MCLELFFLAGAVKEGASLPSDPAPEINVRCFRLSQISPPPPFPAELTIKGLVKNSDPKFLVQMANTDFCVGMCLEKR